MCEKETKEKDVVEGAVASPDSTQDAQAGREQGREVEIYEFEVKKSKDVIFYFRVYEKVDEYGYLQIEWKMKSEEKWHNARRYSKEKKAVIFFSSVEINGKEIQGVRVPDSVHEKIIEIWDRAKEKRKQMVETAFRENLVLDWYWGDWYRVNAFFIYVDKHGEVADDLVEAHLNKMYKEATGRSVIPDTIESVKTSIIRFFDFKWQYTKEEADRVVKQIKEKYNLDVEISRINDARGDFYYVSAIQGRLEDWNKVFYDAYLKDLVEKYQQWKKEVWEKIECDAPLPKPQIPEIPKEIDGVKLIEWREQRITENKLYTTYNFYIANKELIKRNAQWDAENKCWVFKNTEALEKIKNALKRAKEISRERWEKQREVEEKLKERSYYTSYATPCCDPREECDVDVHYKIYFKFKEDAENYASEGDKIEYDNEIGAWVVRGWTHTW